MKEFYFSIRTVIATSQADAIKKIETERFNESHELSSLWLYGTLVFIPNPNSNATYSLKDCYKDYKPIYDKEELIKYK